MCPPTWPSEPRPLSCRVSRGSWTCSGGPARSDFVDHFVNLANAHMPLIFKVENENLTVIRLTRLSRTHDRFGHKCDLIAFDRGFDLEHRQKLRRVLQTAIDLCLSSLAVVFGLGHSDT